MPNRWRRTTTFTRNEWDQLDWEIQQRVKRMTANEIPRLEHQASSGSVVHQTTLGLAYKEGIDKAVDPATGKVTRYNASNGKALDWLRKAADAGFPVAQVELGEMYYARPWSGPETSGNLVAGLKGRRRSITPGQSWICCNYAGKIIPTIRASTSKSGRR